MGFLFSKPQKAPVPREVPVPVPKSAQRALEPTRPQGALARGPLGPLGPLRPLGPHGPLGAPLAPPPPRAPPPPGSQGPVGPQPPDSACCTLQAARCAACTLGTSIDVYCATRGSDARCKVVPAWLTGRVWLGLTARIPENIVMEGGGSQQKEQLGYTHYTPVWTLLRHVEPVDPVQRRRARPAEPRPGLTVGVDRGRVHGLGSSRRRAVPGQRLDAPVLTVERRRGRVRVLRRLARAAVLGARRAEPPALAPAARRATREGSSVTGGSRCRCSTSTARAHRSHKTDVRSRERSSPTRWSMVTLEETSLFFSPDLAPSFLLFFFFFGGGLPTKKRKTKGPRALFVWGA